MQMMLGGFKIVFLALTVSPMVYETLSETPFNKPLNSSLEPRIPPNSTGIDQTSIRYNFTLETELYLFHTNIDRALKQQLMGAI